MAKKHKDTAELQTLSQALAKKIRASEAMTDDLYNLLTMFHARLKILEDDKAERENDQERDRLRAGYRPWKESLTEV